jgi:hypothetical protein
MYDNGHGVGQNFENAFKWASLPAEKGDMKAQFFLDCLYENGEGVDKNFDEAVKWYSLAAKQGDSMAQSNLGHLYADEKTGKQNYIKAHQWLNISGAKEIITMEKLMTPNQIAEAEKLAREWVKKHKKIDLS